NPSSSSCCAGSALPRQTTPTEPIRAFRAPRRRISVPGRPILMKRSPRVNAIMAPCGDDCRSPLCRPHQSPGGTDVPAPMQGELQEPINRFKFGEFEIATILDSKVVREGLHPSHGGEHPASEMEALAAANHIDPKRVEHPFIPTIVNTGRELILF